MQKSDEELIAECREGDETAWSILVSRYQKLIYAIPRRCGFDESGAADVLQQVFIKLLENIEKIEQPSQIKAWLVTTARRETLQILRKQKSANYVSIDEDSENNKIGELVSDTPLADDVLQKLETQHHVRTALGELDERCRKLLILLFYQEIAIPYAEIAAILEIQEGSIGPTRARCLQKLMKLLE